MLRQACGPEASVEVWPWHSFFAIGVACLYWPAKRATSCSLPTNARSGSTRMLRGLCQKCLEKKYRLGIKEMTRLSEACKAANDALLAHLRENHHPVNPAQETASS